MRGREDMGMVTFLVLVGVYLTLGLGLYLLRLLFKYGKFKVLDLVCYVVAWPVIVLEVLDGIGG